jgi:integrase
MEIRRLRTAPDPDPRETVINGQEDYTKTDSSQRHIQIPGLVCDALKEQQKVSKGRFQYVFSTRQGEHLDHNYATKRVWYPLPRHPGFKPRRPYQTRQTAATRWLCAGENPEWIARQMGHATTERRTVFQHYSSDIRAHAEPGALRGSTGRNSA